MMLCSSNVDSHDGVANQLYAVKVVQSDMFLPALERDWNHLSDATVHPNPFASFAWFRAWTKRHAQEVRPGRLKPWVLVLEQNGQVAGISPLVLRLSSRLLRVRKLGFSTPHADYNDLVLGSDQFGQTEAVVNFLAGNTKCWDIADLRDLRDTDGAGIIEQALRRTGLHYRVFSESEGCPFLTVEGNAAFLMKKLSGHVRRTLRRRRERAAAEGLSLRIIERPDREPGLIESLAALDWKKHAHRSSPPFLAAHPEVFQALFDDLGPRGSLYVAMLEQNRQPIAFQLGFRCGKRLWDYTKAYDRSFSRFAPGTLLLPALLDYCFEHGYEEYDFLRGEEEYKTVWSTGCHRRYRIIVWNNRLRSRLQAAAYLKLRVRPTAGA
ncbi:MAG: GNAT family N-acetyltransferase [Terracidiphilus sp.]